MVSGRLELVIETPTSTDHTEKTLQIYDADDEEGGSCEKIIDNIPGPAADLSENNQDLVLRRKRPNSLSRAKPEKRSNKKCVKPKPQEPIGRKTIIGASNYPRPYRNVGLSSGNCGRHCLLDRRERSLGSEDSSAADTAASNTTAHSRAVRLVPQHITQSQKLLKTNIFEAARPQFPTKCLILDIYKVAASQDKVTCKKCITHWHWPDWQLCPGATTGNKVK